MLEATRGYFKGVTNALGVVFGDIGTSPIYTLWAIFSFLPATFENVIGVLSLVIWTLIIIVTIGYAWLAMSLDKKGEGGTIVLRELLLSLLAKPWQKMMITIFSFVAVSLFIGDGVITPAITILSAVEGVLLIPACKDITQGVLIIAACIIAILLFVFQQRGTEYLSHWFGMVMSVWFSVLAITGFASLVHNPSVLVAFNPYYAVRFLIAHWSLAFVVLSYVILCATGGEALYADMGHLGRTPIRRAWYLAMGALFLSYLGQGAFVLANPESKKILYEMVFSQSPSLYVPFLILCVFACIIASQALISGVFSVVYQAIMTNVMPRLKISYTSRKLRSQIYIGMVNWLLMIAVLCMIIGFRETQYLTDAYGFAESGIMLFTGIVMSLIFLLRRSWVQFSFACLVASLNLLFFIANTTKIQHGAYWSIIIALIPLSIVLIYYFGERRLVVAQKPVPFDQFKHQFNQVYSQTAQHIEGVALFFVRKLKEIPPYVTHTMCDMQIVYEENILFSIQVTDDPFGVESSFRETDVPGLRFFELKIGYMEVLDIEKILKKHAIEARIMFYGVEEIATKNILGRIYAVIKRLTPSFVHFHNFPPEKLHGVFRMIKL